MLESRRSPSRLRQRWHRLVRIIDGLLSGGTLADLGTWAVLMLLVGLLLLFVVREIWDGALTGCPGYDGVTYKRETEALCAKP